jgi:hypothetical protein
MRSAFVAVLFSLVNSLHATDWYVGNSGNPSLTSESNGSSNVHHTSKLQDLIDNAADGDDIVIVGDITPFPKPGAQESIQISKKITIRAEGTTHAAINGSSFTNIPVFETSNSIFKYIEFKNAPATAE